MIKIVPAIVAAIIISGCAHTERIAIQNRVIQPPTLVLPDVEQFNAIPVEWMIITPQNYETVINDIRKRGSSVALFSLTDDDYQNLVTNLSNILARSQQQNAVINAYREYNKMIEATIEKHNRTIKTEATP